MMMVLLACLPLEQLLKEQLQKSIEMARLSVVGAVVQNFFISALKGNLNARRCTYAIFKKSLQELVLFMTIFLDTFNASTPI